ncbi:MAG: calcium/proton exchanger [Actinomycetota bacterium]|nr:calcium/proton exchanger [Actinomycetota bacterium]
MRKPNLSWLLILVPVSLAVDLATNQELATFLTAAGAIIPLAGLIGRGTDQLALHAGPRVGGLLNATFGNVTELIISIFLISKGELDIVKASLIGSIIGNLLLVLGLSFLLGGLKHKEQEFNARSAAVHSSSMLLAVIGLVMPALFVLSAGRQSSVQRQVVSVTVAAILIALYVAALVFTLVTHEHLFRTTASGECPEWSARAALLVLIGATALVAVESEILVGALEPALADLGLSRFFVGLVVVPVIGNAAEHSSAVSMALRNKVDVTLEIATGSSTQIALFVAPVLVFISLALGHPMDFVFDTFEVVAVGLSTLIVAVISLDGRSNWLEGAQLVAAYAIMAISFFFVRSL